jgi:hypothetical protein
MSVTGQGPGLAKLVPHFRVSGMRNSQVGRAEAQACSRTKRASRDFAEALATELVSSGGGECADAKHHQPVLTPLGARLWRR